MNVTLAAEFRRKGSVRVLQGVLDITCSEPQDLAAGQFLSMLRFEKRGTYGSGTAGRSGARSEGVRARLTPRLIPLQSCCAGAKHNSVKAPAAFSDYSIRYIRRLLRSGPLEGIIIGQVWLMQIA